MAETKQDKPAFEVSIKCNNCHNVWALQFPTGAAIKQEGVFYPKVIIHMPDIIGIQMVMCPVCESADVTIISRQPLKDKVKQHEDSESSVGNETKIAIFVGDTHLACYQQYEELVKHVANRKEIDAHTVEVTKLVSLDLIWETIKDIVSEKNPHLHNMHKLVVLYWVNTYNKDR
jgi:hypothetical protein